MPDARSTSSPVSDGILALSATIKSPFQGQRSCVEKDRFVKQLVVLRNRISLSAFWYLRPNNSPINHAAARSAEATAVDSARFANVPNSVPVPAVAFQNRWFFGVSHLVRTFDGIRRRSM